MSVKTIFKLTAIVLMAAGSGAYPAALRAQTVNPDQAGVFEQIKPVLVPIISAPDAIAVDRSALFDAGDSSLLPDPAPAPTYLWTFSDGITRSGKEAVRTFDRAGAYTVMLTIAQGQEKATTTHDIAIYNRGVLMVTDSGKEQEVAAVKAQAAAQGIHIEVVEMPKHQTEFLSEDALVNALRANAEFIGDADAYVFFTESQVGLRGFARYWQGLAPGQAQTLRKKFFAVITDGNIKLMEGVAQQTYEIIRPSYILLTRREALNPLFAAADFNAAVATLDQRAIEYRTIDERSERSWVFLLSKLVSRLVAQGMPSNTLYLLLAFPFIVFIIAFARDALGFSAFGVYTPATVATALLILGIKFGLIVFLAVVLVGWTVRWVVDRAELLFIPRTGLVLSALALSFLAIIGVLLLFQSPATISLAVFPMLVMSTVTEKFLAAQAEEGLKHAVWGVVRTVVIVVAAYYAVTWTKFANFITGTPEYVLLPLLALFILGKFTGLRLTEYFRFRTLLREGAEE